MKLYVTFKKPRTIKSFIDNFFNDDLYAVKTYHDKEYTMEHCGVKMRSFDDLYFAVKTYFPSTTPKVVLHNLLVLKKSGKYLQLAECGTMNRIRIIYKEIDPYESSIIINNVFIYKNKPSQSLWSWMELMKMLDIRNYDELKEYVTNGKIKREN